MKETENETENETETEAETVKETENKTENETENEAETVKETEDETENETETETETERRKRVRARAHTHGGALGGIFMKSKARKGVAHRRRRAGNAGNKKKGHTSREERDTQDGRTFRDMELPVQFVSSGSCPTSLYSSSSFIYYHWRVTLSFCVAGLYFSVHVSL